MDLTNRSIAQVIKMRKLRWFSALAALALAACGGGSGCSTSFANSCGTTTPPVVVGSLTLLTSAPQINSDSSNAATISAVVKDANNNVMPDVTVAFQADSGSLAITQAKTDANGLALATLNAGADPSNRTITVTAMVGTKTATVTVAVSGTTLELSGSQSLVLNGIGSYTAVLKNSAGGGIPGVPVALTSALGNTLTPANAASTTDANGRLDFTLTATVGGTDTVTASALGLPPKTVTVAISTQSFNFTAPANGTKVFLGTPQVVTVTWLSNGAPVVGQAVTFATTRGVLTPTTPVITDANGQATVSISSSGAGPSVVNASGTGVSAQLSLDFVANNPTQVSVQAGPATVGVQKQSTITALVRDAANNLVEGATVDFQLVTDPTNGGLAAATATTNAQGSAQVVYTAGNTSSGANGVTISATIHGTAISSNTSLTVGGQTVFLSLGTGNTIDVSQGPAVYQVTYTVFAVDSGGAALASVPVTVAILPVAYGKGVMGNCPTPGPWQPVYATATSDTYSYKGSVMCRNEDSDYTGNINSLGQCPNGSGGFVPCKDDNRNGKLDPGNVAVVSTASASNLTDKNGRLDLLITYPRDHAYWTMVSLVASTTVQGTQSSTSATFVLQGAVDDYKCSIGPPGPSSPYGVATTCANPN
jgi:hypothetical protein